MFGADMLTFQEFMVQEPLPLAIIHNAVLEFLRDRDDVVVFGAQAVNAHVAEPRMTPDVDLISLTAETLAVELREHLHQRFGMAVPIAEVRADGTLRLFQLRRSGNRHLVDIRPADVLPEATRIAGVLVMAPEELIASKVIAYHHRRGQPKSGTDWRDLAMLLLTFPTLKQASGAIDDRLAAAGAGPEIRAAWYELVAQDLRPEVDDDDY